MLTDTTGSPYAKVHALDGMKVKWTGGLWKERFDTCANSTVPQLKHMFDSKDVYKRQLQVSRLFHSPADQIIGSKISSLTIIGNDIICLLYTSVLHYGRAAAFYSVGNYSCRFAFYSFCFFKSSI